MSLLTLALLATSAIAHPLQPQVDTSFPYNGPTVPVGDWLDQTIDGNGKGFTRLTEPPAVAPSSANPTNNINVITLSYIPGGMSVNFATPFGIGANATVKYGSDPKNLDQVAYGQTTTYDRTPPCSLVGAVTMCNQFFHSVPIENLSPASKYSYQIPGGNGTTASQVLEFKTAHPAGWDQGFSVATIVDMGYINAAGTYNQLLKHLDHPEESIAFAWHGGDISYADNWYDGIVPCTDDWPVCYNGSASSTPGPAPVLKIYTDHELPIGEIPSEGSIYGGDGSVLYETGWDIWQQWMNNITMKVPYQVGPGNHEAACAEFNGGGLASYLNHDLKNHTDPKGEYLTYYSCPPSQRNFTAFSNRFNMYGERNNGGKGNHWYSFDYGLAHFVTFSAETDFAYSAEYNFFDETGSWTPPNATSTWETNAGPFGYINGSTKETKNYEQWQWLQKDLQSVNRTLTPWVFAMAHRPMYSTEQGASYNNTRRAFEEVLLDNGVDVYISGHIHWYERMKPLGRNGTINTAAMISDWQYEAQEGKSLIHIIDGQAGNVESHGYGTEKQADTTQVLNYVDYGFGKLAVINSTYATWTFIEGEHGETRDFLEIWKPKASQP